MTFGCQTVHIYICTFSDLFYTAFADAAVAPIDFPIAPAFAVPKVGYEHVVWHLHFLIILQQ